MQTRELTCIGCPMGCQLGVTLQDAVVIEVTGNACKIGDTYARKEVVSPTRIVTSTVAIRGTTERIPVKTASDIPKSAIMEVMHAIRRTLAIAPIVTGDIVIKNVAGTGVDVVATGDWPGTRAELMSKHRPVRHCRG